MDSFNIYQRMDLQLHMVELNPYLEICPNLWNPRTEKDCMLRSLLNLFKMNSQIFVNNVMTEEVEEEECK